MQLHPQVTSKWQEFGIAIGMNDELLNNLQEYSSQENLQQVLGYWIKNNSTEPTWNDLVEILKEIELYTLAEDVVKMYESGKCTSMTLHHACHVFREFEDNLMPIYVQISVCSRKMLIQLLCLLSVIGEFGDIVSRKQSD